ncbi:hypothetical protein ABZ714_26080 [Streptomyces sp. NPDC006798]|uniref:hypothetical protein n=1 Tax=Streptomyces sp. NPDC006798 TaxID=3155462 RepID=UPI0033DB9B79
MTVVRYERGTTRTPGGEHITTVVDGEGTLLGCTRTTPDADAPALPASAWLARFVPGHADGLDVQWVDRHAQEVRDRTGARPTVSGAKVRSRHENGLCTGVIVAGRGRVASYERDIRWDGGERRRAPQMWLHDRWIAAREGGGPAPAAPYARP